jgi:hypothetical protein
MNEPRALTRRAALTLGFGGLALSAGCLGPSLSVQKIESETTDPGTVIALIAVTNDAADAKSAQLAVQCNVISGDTYTKRRQVTVLGSRTNTYRFEFDVAEPEVKNRYQIAADISKDQLKFLERF